LLVVGLWGPIDWSSCRWGEGSVTCGRASRGISESDYYVLIWGCACHRPQSKHTHRETHRALQPRQRGSALPISTLDPTFLTTCRLLAGTHRPAQPAHPQQPHTARAPAGRRSPTGSWAFRPLNGHPPPLQHASPRPRVRASSAVPSSPLNSFSSATQHSISAREAWRKSAIRRRSPPPTP